MGVEIFSVRGDEIGSRLKIWVSREDYENDYVLSWRLTDENGKLVTGVIEEQQGGFSLVEWTPPLELAAYRPANRSFDLDLRVEVLDDRGMIDYHTYTVRLYVPDNADTRPQISEVVLKPVALKAISGVFVEQLSQIRAEITAETVCSRIADYSLQIGSRTVSSEEGELTTSALSVSGTVTVLCTVTDLRGYRSTEELTLNVLPYSLPRTAPATGQSRVRIRRWDKAAGMESESGTAIHIQCSRSYSKVLSEGVQLNYCRLMARLAPADTGQYGSWQQILSEDTEDDQVDLLLPSEISPTREYLVQIMAEDTAGNSSLITQRLAALGCTLHLPGGGKALAVGQYAPGQAERIDFGWQVHLNRGAGLQTLWEGTEASVGQTLPGAACDSALHYHLYLVTAGAVPLLGIRQDGLMMASAGRAVMEFSCTEEAISLDSNSYSQGPTGIYGIL